MKKKIYIPFILVIVMIAGFLGFQQINAATYNQPLYASMDAVATADGTANAYQRDVVGNKEDSAAAGAVTTTESIMAYVKQLVGAQISGDSDTAAILVDTGTTIPGTIATAQADLDILTGASGANLLTATQASIDAIEVDTSTTLPAQITTAQNDLDILTGASGANLLTATQASIDAIEADTSTTIPAQITTAQNDLDIITGASGVNLLTATQATIDALAASALSSYSHPNYLAVATGTFDTTGVWSTVASHEIATVTGMVRMVIIPEVVTTVSSVSNTGTIQLGDEVATDSIIAASTLGSGAMAAGELWVDATLTRTILTRTQLNAIEIVVAGGQDIGYEVVTNAISGGSMIFHIYWAPLDATGAVAAGAGGTL